MATSQEREGKSAARESDEDTEDAAAPSKAGAAMRLVGRYAMLGFGPLVAVVALVVAAMAMSANQSSQEQINKAVAATDSLNKSLEATRSELERLGLSMTQEKNGQNEERKKQDELVAKIVQNVNQMQMKLKISPTLEQQLQPPASAPAAAAPAAAPVPMAGATGADKKLGAQMNAMKEAIEKFNKQ